MKSLAETLGLFDFPKQQVKRSLGVAKKAKNIFRPIPNSQSYRQARLVLGQLFRFCRKW
ncbi:MAG: hypothetical protein IPM26_08510 [Saprospiraceae bacterium]|nr:hypothetical protein [Saprospiraceae bacterium]